MDDSANVDRSPIRTWKQGWRNAVLGPSWGLLSASRGVGAMLTASLAAFLIAYALNVLAISVITVLVLALPREQVFRDLEWRSALPVTFFGWTVWFALVAWIELPRIHVRGSLISSLMRSFRVVASTAVRALVLMVAIPVALDRATHEVVSLIGNPVLIDELGGMLTWVYGGAIVWLAIVPNAMRAGQRESWAQDSIRTCEACGYNLHLLALEARCPECGAAVESSLVSERARPGIAWGRHRGFLNWCRASSLVVLCPGRFYRKIRLREPDHASSTFARWHPLLLACSLQAVVTVLSWYQVRTEQGTFDLPGTTPGERFGAAVCGFVGGVVSTAFLAWAYHRLLGACIATYWTLRSCFPDMRWSAKIIDYESAFLWCVWAGNILIAYAVTGSSGRFTSLFGRPAYYLGMPPEMLYALVVTALTSLIWILRYHRARLAVQWSNF